MDEEEKSKPRSRKKKPSVIGKKIRIGAAVVAGVCVAAATAGCLYYTVEGRQYRTVFFPNTVVNGLDVSGKTVSEAEEIVATNADMYVLTVVGRGGVEEKITGEEIGMHHVFDESLDRYLASQDPMDWWGHRSTTTTYQVSTTLEADEELLKERIDKLVFLDDAQAVEPKDAYLSDYIEGEGYQVIPEEEGTVLDKAKVKELVLDAVHNLDTYLNLEDFDVYRKAGVTSDDSTLNETADKLNSYLAVTVTYQFGDQTEVLDKDTITDWITLEDDGTIVLDHEQAAAYVKSLADRYDTYGKPKTIQVTGGDEPVTITGGAYGWQIDQEKETAALCALIEAGESQVREPEYTYEARSHGENDYGDTYVEVNLTAQHLYFYKDGEMVLESDFVSGKPVRGRETPTGVYSIMYKQKDRILRGERRADGSYQYSSHVNYWMPFVGGVGLHDASWRGAFGGKIYVTNGSHGCVNMPVSAAKNLYELISPGDPVLVFTTDGTGTSEYPSASNSSSSSTNTATQPAQPEETQPAAETQAAEETQPVPETEAVPETQPAPGPLAGRQPTPEETQPIPAETQPIPAETQPAPAETQPSAEPDAPNPGAESQAPSGPMGPITPQETAPAETQPAPEPQPAEAPGPVSPL